VTPPAAYAALERLADALGRDEFATVLTGTGPRPSLTVTRRGVGVAETVYAEAGWYWWSWAERIAATSDPLTAARQIATALRPPAGGTAVTGGTAEEPTLADVQEQYPQWRCARGISELYYAQHETTGTQVTGEDPLDLRDQIKAAEARHAFAQYLGMPSSAGQADQR
jgi:hypothetical protein